MAPENEAVQADEVQIFDVAEAMKRRDQISGRVDMARSPNSFIAVFQTKPRGGETHIHQHPDSDQILFVLRGEVTVEGLSGKHVLKPNQGVLIPAGVHYGFTNTTEEDVVFLTMRTESSGGRRVAYVQNVPSAVQLKIPGPEVDLALLRGEVDGRSQGGHSIIARTPDWIEKSLVHFHAVFEIPRGFRDKHPVFEPLPSFESLTRTDIQRRVLAMSRNFRLTGSPFVLPPGTPKERADVMKGAFRKVFNDPEFLKKFEQMTGAEAFP
jgi:mannose-6-phosphate isomerase-like protein (cupin superfamily)